MSWNDVNTLSTNKIQINSSVANETPPSGETGVVLINIQKNSTEWNGKSAWEIVRDNDFSSAELIKSELKLLYPDKEIDLDGLHYTIVTPP